MTKKPKMTKAELALFLGKEYNWPIIPIRGRAYAIGDTEEELKDSSKIPLLRWTEFQKRLPTVNEIKFWFDKWPKANLGLVTGDFPGVVVVDIDEADEAKEAGIAQILPETTQPVVLSRQGCHRYYSSVDKRFRNNVGSNIKGCDFRANGGYIVIPPSIHWSGFKYKWKVPPSKIPHYQWPQLPEAYKKIIVANLVKFNGGPSTPTNTKHLYGKGRRDEDLFHAANCLLRGGMDEEVVKQTMMGLALSCNPPFSQKEALVKVQSVLDRSQRRDHQWSSEVKNFIDGLNTSWFWTHDAYNEVEASSQQEKKNVRTCLARFVKDGKIERHDLAHGKYRKIDTEIKVLDYMNASEEPLDFVFPLGISKFAEVYDGNIIIIAGAKDSGKTAFALDTVRLNMGKYKDEINYFSSEMSASELKKRLMNFELYHQTPLASWVKDFGVNFYDKSKNFADFTEPGKINIYDFMEYNNSEELVAAGKPIKEIFDKLDKKGLAIIMLQKELYRDVARGGSATAEKSRLYIALNPRKAKIVSAKNHAIDVNPNGFVVEYKLYKGVRYEITKEWAMEEEK